ncbi:MAG: penicillin-binding transpeptidase domain-containing protein [Candidatus Omnitrophica bacterium]|nr:penicillin-binding transpeptidase domain-containing protein [Candidatus Omnitrophota bacterium]
MEKRIHEFRLILVFLLFITLQTLLISRLFYLQIAKSIYLSKIANSQHDVLVELEPRRGAIYDRNMYKLAFNINVDSVFGIPREIPEKDKARIASKTASALNEDEQFILRRLKRNKGFIWLKRKISDEESEALKGLDLKGIELIKESKRVYPNGYLAAHIIGFAGLDNVGLEGLELAQDRYLSGKAGFRLTNRDAKRRFLSATDKKVLEPINGFSLILNIDETIQNIAEQSLDAAYKKYNAKGATVIVMDPYNGEILALANRPAFDPNRFFNSDLDSHRNRAVTDTFEPGSVFKIVTASCALEKGVVGFKDKIFCENGKYYIAGHTLHDHTAHGMLTFKEVIEQSSNIGTVKVAQRLKKEDLYAFVRGFGFGQATGIDMMGEVNGTTYPPSKWSKSTIAALPMGQEVTVTAIQLACAISAIANGGELVKPWILREIRDDRGETIAGFEPAVVRRVISKETAEKMKTLLKGVIENGTGTLARLESHTAGGKTGTAQKVEPGGIYSHSKFVGSFIGFAPASNPRIAIAVCLDEPHPLYYGGVVSAPVFKKVAEDTLRYLGVPPDIKRPEPLKVILGAQED